MTKYKIQDIIQSYENFKIKINGKWVYITREKLKEILKKSNATGTIIKKRTRTWLE